MAGADIHEKRPLSPHLQVYKPMLTMMMSIVHRITGVGLYFGMFFLCWWLVAAASGAEYFAIVNGLYSSWFGLIILLGFTWALMHHMIGGLRHFIWDTGRGFELETIELMAKASIAASVGLTVLLWIIAFSVR